MNAPQKAGYWYLLTGLLLGLMAGLLYAWWVAPVDFQNASTPASLRADFKDEYRLLAASAYAANGNLERARVRLALLGGDPLSMLAEQTQRLMAGNASAESVRLLSLLAEAFQSPTVEVANPGNASTSQTDVPQVNSSASPLTTLDDAAFAPPVTQLAPVTPVPSQPTLAALLPTRILAPHAPSATPGAPFALLDQISFCAPENPGLLEIRLLNAADVPAVGIPIIITWPGGEETIFTGLKPDIGGNGYADFEMTPGVEYVLQLSANTTRITGLLTSTCVDSAGSAYPGGLQLEFQQP